jgi:type IV pilus assembly protein PilO
MSNGDTSSAWREQLKSPLAWHYIGFAVMLLLVVGIGVRLGLDWSAISSNADNALAGKQIQLKALELQTAPLRGLDKRVDDSRTQMQSFYGKRIPTNYSSISSRIGELEVASGVRLSRIQYSQGAAGPDLTEIAIDSTVSGEYPQILRFINSLERDQTFFVIRAMALAGQQGGLVNLRLNFSTWMRHADAAASGLPIAQQAAEEAPQPSGREVE